MTRQIFQKYIFLSLFFFGINTMRIVDTFNNLGIQTNELKLWNIDPLKLGNLIEEGSDGIVYGLDEDWVCKMETDCTLDRKMNELHAWNTVSKIPDYKKYFIILERCDIYLQEDNEEVFELGMDSFIGTSSNLKLKLESNSSSAFNKENSSKITLPNDSSDFSASQKFNLLCYMNRADGSLLNLLKNHKNGKELERIGIFKYLHPTLIKAIEILHDKGVAHCDLRPANIVYKKENDEYKFYIIDFSRARSVEQNYNIDFRFLYAPPFLNNPAKPIIKKLNIISDYWALALVFLEVINTELFHMIEELDIFLDRKTLNITNYTEVEEYYKSFNNILKIILDKKTENELYLHIVKYFCYVKEFGLYSNMSNCNTDFKGIISATSRQSIYTLRDSSINKKKEDFFHFNKI